ncbi:MAG TPA: arsenate reductase ArsC [Limnobacter sp.]|uniref:arsenate reductase ArsC n=1 Tax=Limnobacter sp. TaxID=2003368 RepID=UPI002E329C78|nr:arsenate reductase ArsC [Limnobacter sp.]HEX5485694.1 arsenate reductase ArsC [Limnobacter sp.]
MTFNVLVLCTHNSARSVLGEAMVNHLAKRLGRPFKAYSAGSSPSGRVNPFALEVLQHAGIDTAGVRSKSWDEFAQSDSPQMDIVITVCDSAAAEACPFWPGAPVKIHWGFPDPSRAPGDDSAKRIAFEITRQAIGYKILQLMALPIEEMSQTELQAALNLIANS